MAATLSASAPERGWRLWRPVRYLIPGPRPRNDAPSDPARPGSDHPRGRTRPSYYGAIGRLPSPRAARDEQLKDAIAVVHQASYGVYGARMVWLALNRERTAVARCTVERLMRELGLAGARRGKRHRTTVPDPAAARPADLAGRRFSPPALDRLWVADFTYVATWSAMVYVAFVIDACSRQILGWRAATTMRTALVLDALEQAIWTRQRGGSASLAGLVHHHDGARRTRSHRCGPPIAAVYPAAH
jgi:putative transposase